MKSHNENDHTKGALCKKTSRRTDKNQFWLGGRFFNTASPRLGARTQRKVSSQDGLPNATQGDFATWATKCTKSRNKTHEEPGQGWATKGKARRVGKRGTQMQCKAGWLYGRPNARRAVTEHTNGCNETHEEP
jgi:hypothetical protein